MNITPFAPLIGIHRKKCFGALFGAQRPEKCFGSFAYGLRRNADLLNAKQPWNNRAVGGDPLERLSRRGEGFFQIVRRSASGMKRPIGTAFGAGVRQTASAWIDRHREDLL